MMFGVFLEQVEKCKAVHLRHEQIEKDYARRCLIDALEPCSTIRRPVDRAPLALKQLSDEINDVRIVVDHEDTPIVRSNSGQRAYQCLPIERFHNVIGGAEPKTELLLVDYRDEDDRNVARQSVCLKRVQNLPSVCTGHNNIESNGQRLKLARLLKAVFAAAGGDYRVTRVGEILLEQIDDIRIVVDRKHDLISESSGKCSRDRRGLRLLLAFRCHRQPLRDFEREPRSRTFFTFDSNLAVQHSGESIADR